MRRSNREKSKTEMMNLITGLLERQLFVIDSQLVAEEPGGGPRESAMIALTELRDLCSMTKDLVNSLEKRRLRWLRIGMGARFGRDFSN